MDINNEMVLGVSINLFDGEELLKDALLNLKDSVNYVSIVYQTKSNYGEPCSENLETYLYSLIDEGLVNDIIHYSPIPHMGPHQNEINKRGIGLNASKNNNCTHHMSMDCDEFYVKDEFDLLKKIMLDGDYGASVAQMVTYYKEPKYRFDPKETYYVPVITKIVPGLQYGLGRLGVLTDPTRTTNSTNVLVVPRELLEMHHMSYIRKDISKKLNNSSAKINFRGIQKMVDHYNNWSFPGVALMNGETGAHYKIAETQQKFELLNYIEYVK